MKEYHLYKNTEIELCKYYAESLPYPVALIGDEGTILYKNTNFKCVNLKWRVGAKVERYIGKKAFLSLRGLRIGSYVAIPNFEIGSVGLRVGAYRLVVFLPKFEIHDSFAEIIYNHIGNIPEKDFFESRDICFLGEKSGEAFQRWEKFKKGFNDFYNQKRSYDLEISHVFDNCDNRKSYNLAHVVDTISKIVNNASSRFGYSMVIKGMETAGEHMVEASAADMCAVVSILLFLCARCSTCKKPVVHVEFYKALEASFVNRICFSVKSDIAISALEAKRGNDVRSGEISLYYKTLIHLASKYFWGIRACRDDTDLHIIMLLSRGESSANLWLNDSGEHEDVEVKDAFTSFADITGVANFDEN